MRSIRRSSSPRDLGRREEVEAAALAADQVDQRLVAVGADALRQADDRGVLRHQQRHAAHDERGAEGDDEGRHLELGDDRAVDEPDRRGAGDRGEKADDRRREQRHPGVEGGADGERREHRGEAHHPADREVDAGADDDEGLAEPEQQDRDDRDEDVLRVADGQEAGAGARDRHRDDEEDDQHREERPGPEPAEGDDACRSAAVVPASAALTVDPCRGGKRGAVPGAPRGPAPTGPAPGR